MSSARGRGPVVIVDDDALVRQVVARTLEKAGFRTVSREGGFGLSSVVASEAPSVVILDVSMPGLDGPGVWAIARGVLAAPPSLLFHSALPAEELELLCMRFPEASALAKPVATRALVAAVEAADRSCVERRANVATLRRTPPRGHPV